MPLLDTIRARKPDILAIATRYGAKNIRVFGSVARGEERPDSDIDLLVEMEKGRSAFDLVGFKLDAEELLARRCDVVTDVHWMIRDRVLQEALPL